MHTIQTPINEDDSSRQYLTKLIIKQLDAISKRLKRDLQERFLNLCNFKHTKNLNSAKLQIYLRLMQTITMN